MDPPGLIVGGGGGGNPPELGWRVGGEEIEKLKNLPPLRPRQVETHCGDKCTGRAGRMLRN